MTPNYNIHLIFSYISLFSVLIPLVVGLIRRRHFSPDARVMFVLVLAAILVETIIFTLHRYHVNNLFVLRINTIVEFSLLSMFFTHVFRNFRIIVVIRLLILAFVGVAVFDLQLNGIDHMDNISSAVESIMLMLYSLSGFYYQITRPMYSNILATPLFWFNTAILIYFSGDLFLFIFTNYVRSHLSSFSYALWDIHSFVNILFYILVSVGFWKTKLPLSHSVKSIDSSL